MNRLSLVHAFFLATLMILTSCASSKLTKEQQALLSASKRQIKTLPTKMEVDKLGNIYTIDVSRQLVVWNENGKSKFKYSDKRLGNIHSMDVSNALKILIFHKDFATLRLLDNTLNIVETVPLLQNGRFAAVTLTALSNDGQFWLFDEQKQKIFKVDRNLNVLAETNHFNDLGLIGFKPVKLMERSNMLVVSGEGSDFIIFDNFGQMIKKLEAPHPIDFQFDGESILYYTATGLKNQPINYPSFTAIGIPKEIRNEPIDNIKLENNKWYVQYQDGIDVMERSRKK